MVCYVVVGATGSGKTFFCKNSILEKYPNVLVYDIQNEYELPIWDKLAKKGRFRILPSQMTQKQFMELGNALSNFLFVYDEATQYVTGALPEKLRENLVGKRHAKNRYMFMYHGFTFIPPRLVAFVDYLVQFSVSKSEYLTGSKKLKLNDINLCGEMLNELPLYSKKIHKISGLAKQGVF